jgi:hypothetical protein
LPVSRRTLGSFCQNFEWIVFWTLTTFGREPSKRLWRFGGSTVASGGKEGKNQAIGISRSGRTIKIHAIVDSKGRPLSFIVTGGQVPRNAGKLPRTR